MGKSALAERYARDHALALVLDIDELRRHLGQWETADASKAVARDLALALVTDHLGRGGDVVVPQFFGRREFAEVLRRTAADAAVPFVEVLIDAQNLNGDHRPDLIAGTSDKAVYVLLARPGRTWAKAASVPAVPATHICAADLDGDGAADLALTYFTESRAAGGEQAGASQEALDRVQVLWGTPGRIAFAESTTLKIANAVATAAGDLDGDGRPDLAVAIHQGEKTFNGESVVFFGEGKRRLRRGKALRNARRSRRVGSQLQQPHALSAVA